MANELVKRIVAAGEKLAAQMGWEFKIVPRKLRDLEARARHQDRG